MIDLYRVGNLSPAMEARNQVGKQGCRTGPPAYVAWLLNSRLGFWNRFLAPQRDLRFRLCSVHLAIGSPIGRTFIIMFFRQSSVRPRLLLLVKCTVILAVHYVQNQQLVHQQMFLFTLAKLSNKFSLYFLRKCSLHCSIVKNLTGVILSTTLLSKFIYKVPRLGFLQM